MPLPFWVRPLVRLFVSELVRYIPELFSRVFDDAAGFDFEAAAFDSGTCPADCPGPSLDFCLGPVRDALSTRLLAVETLIVDHLGLVLLAFFALGFAAAKVHTRWAAPARAPRPHGRPDPRGRGDHQLGLHRGGH